MVDVAGGGADGRPSCAGELDESQHAWQPRGIHLSLEQGVTSDDECVRCGALRVRRDPTQRRRPKRPRAV